MSVTLIDGGPAGPDEVGGQYRNRILTDRLAWWRALGGRQGVLDGFVHSVVAGQMALEFTAGVAAVQERDSLGVPNTGRGYLVWTPDTAVVPFGAASASDRKDAVVIAFCDLAAGSGSLGTETSVVGGQIVVVPGVSGVTTVRSDADIQAAVGAGGWVRYADVLIPGSSTEIAAGNVTLSAGRSGAQPFGFRHAAAAQNVADATTATLALGVVGEATGLAPVADGFQVLTAGKYRIEAIATWASNSSGQRETRILVNGNVVRTKKTNAATGGATYADVLRTMRLAVGDVVTVLVLHTAGSSQSTAQNSDWHNSLTMTYDGA